MTLIAKNGDLELYRKVLLASASFPIVFPPVEIDGHLFGDGAARSNIVVTGLAGTKPPGPPRYGSGNSPGQRVTAFGLELAPVLLEKLVDLGDISLA